LDELHRRFSPSGLIVLAVNEDKSRGAMIEFLKDHPVSFAVVRDIERKLAAKVNVPALPTSYVLDGTGKVLWIESGARIAQKRKEFKRRIESFLNKNQAP